MERIRLARLFALAFAFAAIGAVDGSARDLSLSPASRIRWLAEPAPLPAELVLRGLGERTLRLKGPEKKLLIINFWATWCAPCVAELPSLVRLQKRFPRSTLEVALVTIDRDDGAVRRFLGAHKIPAGSVYTDADAKVTQSLRIHALPATVIVDPRRGTVGRVAGFLDWNDAGVRRALVARVPTKTPAHD